MSINCDETSDDFNNFFYFTCWDWARYFKVSYAIIISDIILLCAGSFVGGYYIYKSSLESSGEYLNMVNDNAETNFEKGTTWTVFGQSWTDETG